MVNEQDFASTDGLVDGLLKGLCIISDTITFGYVSI